MRHELAGTASEERSPTTADLRAKPRLIVFTGDGKGKSTAAFGLALRSWHRGWPIGVFQFVKGGTWRPGERAAFEQLNAMHEASGVGAPVEWHTLGAGFTWLRSNSDVDHAELARVGWAEVTGRLARQQHTVYVLDEFTYPLANGWLDTAEVVATLVRRPGVQHVVITGRRAPQALIDAADLVTDMRKITHPFDVGEPGQAGIEW